MGRNQKTEETYFHHYFDSIGVRKIHSPFVYRFYTEVLRDRKNRRIPELRGLSKSERLFRRLILHFQVASFLEISPKSKPFTPLWGGGASDFVLQEERKGVKSIHPKNGACYGLPVINITKIEPWPTDSFSGIMKGKDLIYVMNRNEEEVILIFENMQSEVENDTILVLDKIHQSPAMERAWKRMKESTTVTLTIDIFYFGFVFFRQEVKEKQHFKLRY